ncbi:MAG TPA: FAD-binding protein [Acidimicrobiales bacterium]|nr:FAD-binding protein [Acidimicrobiales bacterium]
MSGPLRIAVLVKQIPAFEAMELGPDGRLVRDGLPLEMNAYCRRAVALGTDLAVRTGGSMAVFTLGPPSAEDCLREAIAWGAQTGLEVDGVLVTDPAFAGSDTLATAKALAAVLEQEDPFDLVLVGRNSVDADTGQVGPQLAQLLDLPFATGVRELELGDDEVVLRLEHDDEWVDATVQLPALLSCAERLIDPAKQPPEARAAVPAQRIRTVSAADLGEGPWGADASPTWVGDVRLLEVERVGEILTGPVEAQVERLVEVLDDRGVLDPAPPDEEVVPVAAPSGADGPCIAVVVEPDRTRLTRELLGAAARLADRLPGRVAAVGPGPLPEAVGTWGADDAVTVEGAEVEEDVATGVARWAMAARPWAILAPGTAWGREVASRVAATLGAGLTGDAVALTIEDGRLEALKPAFGGRLVAVVTASSPVQMATVRAGMLPLFAPRTPVELRREAVNIEPRGRVVVTSRERDDDTGLMANADAVVGVGRGVPPDRYEDLKPLLDLLDGELGATRKVTDEGWLPRARQIGITGHSISPRLYIALGLGGKFNHTVGVRASGTIVAVNPDPEAPIFEWVDIGLVASWEDVLPVLVDRLGAR